MQDRANRDCRPRSGAASTRDFTSWSAFPAGSRITSLRAARTIQGSSHRAEKWTPRCSHHDAGRCAAGDV